MTGFLTRLFGPQHCMTCGDEFIETSYREGFRKGDGTPIIRTWKHCPRSVESSPSRFESYQQGRCWGLPPFACAIEVETYRAHKPPKCIHHSVSEDGDACWTKGGQQLTIGHRRVVIALAGRGISGLEIV